MKQKSYFAGFIPDKNYLKTEEYIIRNGFKVLGSGYPPHEIFPYSYVFIKNNRHIHLQKQLSGDRWDVIEEIDNSKGGLELKEAIKHVKLTLNQNK